MTVSEKLVALSACMSMLWDYCEEQDPPIPLPDLPPQSWDIADRCPQRIMFVWSMPIQIRIPTRLNISRAFRIDIRYISPENESRTRCPECGSRNCSCMPF